MTPYQISPDSPVRRSTAGTVLYLLAGPIVWAAHLTAVYFSQSMLCAHSLAGRGIAGVGIVPVVVTAATAISLAVLVAIVLTSYFTGRSADVPTRKDTDAASHRRIMTALAVLSAIGIAWAGATILAVPACPPLR